MIHVIIVLFCLSQKVTNIIQLTISVYDSIRKRILLHYFGSESID